MKDIIAMLDENAKIGLIPVENNESVAEKTPRRQRQTGIMQFFLQQGMNKIAFGRTINVLLLPI